MKIKDKQAMLMKAGDYFIDVSKLVFAGIVLAVIMNLHINDWFLLVVGAIVTLLSVIAGFIFINVSSTLND
jgi:hypothetical protein